ncbi:MAG: hypothetical protein DLM58_20355 [Pseudonocardiales bacterium]|nr:MAG: hypothetical protein DLM58_20355 [Pseudonocardiales bacterium]
MSRHPAAEPTDTLTIPKELWYPTPVHTNVAPAPRPRLSWRTRLMPLVALLGGYTSARASTAHIDAAASALLLLAFAALVAFGVGVVRYGAATVRHHRSAGGR